MKPAQICFYSRAHHHTITLGVNRKARRAPFQGLRRKRLRAWMGSRVNFATGHAYFIGDASLRGFVNSLEVNSASLHTNVLRLAFTVFCSAIQQSAIFTHEIIKGVKIADANGGGLFLSFHMAPLKFALESAKPTNRRICAFERFLSR